MRLLVTLAAAMLAFSLPLRANPAPGAPPTAKEQLKIGLGHAMYARFTHWWQGLGHHCPACGEETLASTPVGEQHTMSTSGECSKSYTHMRLQCSACGWTFVFERPNAAPEAPDAPPRLEKPAGPRLVWEVLSWNTGNPVGRIIAGGGQDTVVEETAHTPTAHAILEVGRILVDFAVRTDLSELNDADALQIRRDVVSRLLEDGAGKLDGDPHAP